MSAFGYILNIVAMSVGFTLAISSQDWGEAVWIFAAALWMARTYVAEHQQ